MEKILVTGGAGFIGSNFVRMLLKRRRKLHVTVIDKLTYAGNLANLSPVMEEGNLEFIRGDICSPRLLDRVIPGMDIIYNFAAETHVDRSILKAKNFVDTDIMGTYRLLQAAMKYMIPRFVQISTDEVYGSISEGKFRETDPVRPNSPYSATKSAADLLVMSFHKTYGLPVVITRSSNNYGPYQHPEKFIPLFITNAIDGMPLPLYGDGKNVRDWIYVEDNCRAIELVGRKGRFGEIYNIGANEEKTNIHIAKEIIRHVGARNDLVVFISDRPGHDRRYALSTRKIKRLGWKKRIYFGEGLKKTVKWYIRNEKWWREIKGEKFKKYYSKIYGKRIDRALKGGGILSENCGSRRR